jgi:hypothetical protein
MWTFRIQLVLHIVLILGLLWLPALYCQTSTASLTGTIHDVTGAVLPGVTVTVTDSERNTSLSTLANDAGSYVIPVLNPGTYSLSGARWVQTLSARRCCSPGSPGGEIGRNPRVGGSDPIDRGVRRHATG